MLKLKLQQFAAPGNTTALRADTFNKLQLNAGILIKNHDYAGITDSTALKTQIAGIIGGTVTGKGDIIGATRGGGTFTASRDMRSVDVDGMRYGFKGSDFVDSVDAYLSTTLIEVTPQNVQDLLTAGVTPTTSGKITTVKMNTAITSSNYLTNICWIGDLADGQMVEICLKNAINTADFTLTYTDKGEGTLAAEFHARQASVSDYDYAPFEVVFFDNPAT